MPADLLVDRDIGEVQERFLYNPGPTSSRSWQLLGPDIHLLKRGSQVALV